MAPNENSVPVAMIGSEPSSGPVMHGRIAAVIAFLVACALGAPTSAQTPARAGGNQAAQPDAPLSALAPSNLAKPRPKPPFDLTGNWFIDTTGNPEAWRFGAPYPAFTPAAQVHIDASRKAM